MDNTWSTHHLTDQSMNKWNNNMPFFLKGGHRNRKLFQIAKKYFEIGFLAGMFSVYMYNANKKPGTFYLKNFLFSRLLLYLLLRFVLCVLSFHYLRFLVKAFSNQSSLSFEIQFNKCIEISGKLNFDKRPMCHIAQISYRIYLT